MTCPYCVYGDILTCLDKGSLSNDRGDNTRILVGTKSQFTMMLFCGQLPRFVLRANLRGYDIVVQKSNQIFS